jgi:hypothetical protein
MKVFLLPALKGPLLKQAIFSISKNPSRFHSLYSAIINGELTKWSIGGSTPAIPATVGLLGTP